LQKENPSFPFEEVTSLLRLWQSILKTVIFLKNLQKSIKMLMPSKRINFSQSLLGFGSYLLAKLNRPMSVDEMWQMYQADYKRGDYAAKHSFDSLRGECN
jgi:hypothetical protein